MRKENLTWALLAHWMVISCWAMTERTWMGNDSDGELGTTRLLSNKLLHSPFAIWHFEWSAIVEQWRREPQCRCDWIRRSKTKHRIEPARKRNDPSSCSRDPITNPQERLWNCKSYWKNQILEDFLESDCLPRILPTSHLPPSNWRPHIVWLELWPNPL